VSRYERFIDALFGDQPPLALPMPLGADVEGHLHKPIHESLNDVHGLRRRILEQCNVQRNKTLLPFLTRY
jgi:hypothetical protein